jgi:hypothetical protein
VVAIHDFARHAGEDCGLTLLSALVAALEPVPAPRTIGGMRLLGIENETLPLLGERVHAGAVGKIIGCLRAPVQHHNERERLPCVTRRDIELVGTSSGLIGIEPRDELSRLPISRPRLGRRHVERGVAPSPLAQQALEVGARRFVIARCSMKWSQTAVGGLCDLGRLYIDDIADRATFRNRSFAIGVLCKGRAAPKNTLNECSGFKKATLARELSRFDEVGGHSFVRNHHVPSKAVVDS